MTAVGALYTNTLCLPGKLSNCIIIIFKERIWIMDFPRARERKITVFNLRIEWFISTIASTTMYCIQFISIVCSVYWCPMNKYVYSIYFGSNTENFNVSLGVCVLIEFVFFFLLLLLSFVVLFFYFSSMGRKEGLGECGLKSDCQRSLNIEPHFLLIGFIICFARSLFFSLSVHKTSVDENNKCQRISTHFPFIHPATCSLDKISQFIWIYRVLGMDAVLLFSGGVSVN